jgi:hypothetical protein
MKDLLDRFPNRISLKSRLLLWLAISSLITSVHLLLSYEQIAFQLRNNRFSSLLDVVVVILAFVAVIIFGIFGCAIEYFASQVSGRLFDVAPEAMMQIQRVQVKLFHLLLTICNVVLRLFAFTQLAVRKITPPKDRRLSQSPAQFNSASPYLVFPISCILLN